MRIDQKNVFISNGYTIGYDTDYKRFLLTAKSRKVLGNVKYDYTETPGYFATLQVGDISIKNGRYQKFLGVNDSVIVHCDNLPEPEVNSLTFTIPESTLVGTLIGTIPGTGVEDYIIAFNDGTFHMVDNQFYLNSPVDYETKNLYVVTVIAKGPGGETPFTVTVHVTNVIGEPPIAEDNIRFINENVPANTFVHQVIASDPGGLALTYTITGGNTSGAFSINSLTGEIRVANSSAIDYEINPLFDLTITVSNGTRSVTCLIKVSITNLPEAPQPVSTSLTILDTAQEGVIGTLEISDPEGGPQILQTVSESVPGVFSVHPTTGEITLNDNSVLNAGTTPLYTLGMRATDNSNLYTDFNLSIHVNYDPETIIFEPLNPVLSGTGRSRIMALTSKAWANIRVKTTAGVITVLPNTPGQVFQGIPVHVYPPVDNHVDCGGSVNHFMSEVRTATAAKNNCTTGLGSIVKYTIPAGFYMSTVSLADANALADADLLTNKQTNANTKGECL